MVVTITPLEFKLPSLFEQLQEYTPESLVVTGVIVSVPENGLESSIECSVGIKLLC